MSGTGFASGDTVDFGSNAASDVTVASGSSLTAVAPPGAEGPVDVTVMNSAGTSATSASDRFTYVAADHTATTVSPRVVGVPGTALELDVTCPPTKVSCAGSVLVRTVDAIATGKLARGGKAIKAKVTLGSAAFSLAGGQSRTLTIKLSAANQALLRRYRVLSANIEVTTRDSFGDPGVVTVKTVFKAPTTSHEHEAQALASPCCAVVDAAGLRMKLAAVTFGSRGDVEPYAALGRELVAAGYEVRLAAQEAFRDFASDCRGGVLRRTRAQHPGSRRQPGGQGVGGQPPQPRRPRPPTGPAQRRPGARARTHLHRCAGGDRGRRRGALLPGDVPCP